MNDPAVAALPLFPIAYVVVALAIETIGVRFSGQPWGPHGTTVRQ